MLASIFGIEAEVKQTSVNDRLARKKYMGVWRWGSEMMARMMSKFPMIVTRYMPRKVTNRKGCSSRFSENPRRRKSETVVWFI